MGEERARILKMLEEGRITAEQAARLIEALGSRRPDVPPVPPIPPLPMGRHWRRHSFRDLDHIPDLVAKAVSAAVRCEAGGSNGDEESSEFPGKRNLSMKSVSGDVEVCGWAEERVQVGYSGGMVKARSRDDVVTVNSVSGDLTARMPADGRLELVTVSGDVSVEETRGGTAVKTVSGNVEVSGVTGRVTVATVSGDVEMGGLSGDIEVSTKSGDVEIGASGTLAGSVNTRSGDVTLLLPSNADVVLDLVSEEGGDVDVELETQHQMLEAPEGGVRVKLGAGTRAISVRTENGDIKVREAEER
ncbi:hypothetical protein FJY71_01830 [candidate division WOR-3 bacterium]|nr:hypothetical protein [candidate division WOR-3 bacterium]